MKKRSRKDTQILQYSSNIKTYINLIRNVVDGSDEESMGFWLGRIEEITNRLEELAE